MFKVLCSIIWIRKLELRKQISNFFSGCESNFYSLDSLGLFFLRWGLAVFPGLSVPSPPPFHMLATQKTSLELFVIRSYLLASRFSRTYGLHFGRCWTVSCRIGANHAWQRILYCFMVWHLWSTVVQSWIQYFLYIVMLNGQSSGVLGSNPSCPHSTLPGLKLSVSILLSLSKPLFVSRKVRIMLVL